MVRFHSSSGISRIEEDYYCVEKNCTLIGFAIGAGAGFVIGAIAGAAMKSEAGGGRGRSNLTVVPLHDGRLGFGASVRF